jgi:hypothetical protein
MGDSMQRIKRIKQNKHHDELWNVCSTKRKDFKSWASLTEKPDCSCGCKTYHRLDGKEGADWGICFNPKSLHAGKLTFEHMGCIYFKA